MTEPAIVRGAHLKVYLRLLRGIGVPVEDKIDKSHLPHLIEDNPDEFVSIPLALNWLACCGTDLTPMELGFLAAESASLSALSRDVLQPIMAAPTVLARVETLLRLAGREDNALVAGWVREDSQIRIICDMPTLGRFPFLCYAEWLNLHGFIQTVRSLAGPNWCPTEITFVSTYRPSQASHEAFPDTRILVGQRHSSIVIRPDDFVSADCETGSLIRQSSVAELGKMFHTHDWNFVAILRALIRPYLSQGSPDIAFISETVGISKRTMQRRLQASGRTYAELLGEARFEIAQEMLRDPSMNITDVAFMAGYKNPPHFSRAFRRIAGVTPSFFRRSLIANV